MGYPVPDTLPIEISAFSAGYAREQLFRAALAFHIGIQTRSLTFASQVTRPLVNKLFTLGDIKAFYNRQIEFLLNSADSFCPVNDVNW